MIIALSRQKRKEKGKVYGKNGNKAEALESIRTFPGGLVGFVKAYISMDEQKRAIIEKLVTLSEEEQKKVVPVLSEWNSRPDHDAEELRKRLQETNII